MGEGNGSFITTRQKSSGRMWQVRWALAASLVTAVSLAALTWIGLSWLLDFPARKDTSTQLDLMKLVFAVVAGLGGVVALVMTYRRQRTAERTQEHAEQIARKTAEHAERVARDSKEDATERRITELYGQAVEQLGHDKAAVRLGGLYSLERLGQTHERYRQTVVDVVCAYLRMPFRAPSTAALVFDDGSAGGENPGAAEPGLPDESEAHQEGQVRLTAQRLLERHLIVPRDASGEQSGSLPETFWESMTVDLSGAMLLNFEASDWRMADAYFHATNFYGNAWFKGAIFKGDAEFGGATFNGNAVFGRATFSGTTWFGSATFNKDAEFEEAILNGDAFFKEATFKGKALFGEATFNGYATFGEAKFSRDALFGKATFNGDTLFTDATFNRDALLEEVSFGGIIAFAQATFNGTAVFGGAIFRQDALFMEATFNGEAVFMGAMFNGEAGFQEAAFSVGAGLGGATSRYPDTGSVWPAGWRVEPDSADEPIGQLVRDSG